MDAIGPAASLCQADVAFETVTQAQSRLQHVSMRFAEQLFLEEQTLEDDLHHKSQQLAQTLHDLTLQHKQRIQRREAARDSWSRRNQMIQTLMVVDTLMFTGATSIFAEGDLPAEGQTPIAVVYCHVICLGLSTGLLLLSVWLAAVAQQRMGFTERDGDIHYPCGGKHHNYDDYLETHCAHFEQAAYATFAVGSTFTLCSAAISAAARFAVQDAIPGVSVYAAVTCFSILASAAAAKLLWPPTSRMEGR